MLAKHGRNVLEDRRSLGNRENWIGYFLSTYIIITLIPFIVVNGVLTGFLDNINPPVWYNINEIIGVRIITIPIENEKGSLKAKDLHKIVLKNKIRSENCKNFYDALKMTLDHPLLVA